MSSNQVLPISRPTGLVTSTIKIEGAAISEAYGVLSIVVNKEINKIPSATLAIQDGSASKEDFEVSNQDLFIPGKAIEILSGYHSDEETLFKGLIIKHSIKIKGDGTTMLLLECRDEAVKLTIGRKNKYFIDKKDSEVIEEILETYSLENDIEETSVQQ